MEENSYRKNILTKLKRRNARESKPFEALFEAQGKIFEQNLQLKSENSTLSFVNEKLKEENVILKAKIDSTSESTNIQSSESFLEQQRKLFSLQEELTELHRRKGDNAQQVIDLTAAVKVNEVQIAEKISMIECLEAELIGVREELKSADKQISELQSTNQLLRDEYQALQLALNSAETKTRSIQAENERLVQNVMQLKDQIADSMNKEVNQFRQQQQRLMQQELAEAAKEQKSVSPEKAMDAMIPEADALIQGVEVVPSKVQMRFEAHEGEVMCVRWDVMGKYFATAGADRKIKIWEISKGINVDLKSTLAGSNAAVMGIDFDATGSLILGASNDFASRVWSVDDGRLRHTLTGHSNKVSSAKFMGDTTRVVTGSHDRTLKIWDLRSKTCMVTKFAMSTCYDLVTTSQVIMSGHHDCKIRVWDNRNSSTEPMKEIVVGGKVTSLNLSRDESKLAVCSRDDKIQIYDLRGGGQVINTLVGDGYHVGCDWSRICLSPSADYVVGGGGEGGIHVWNVNTGQTETILRGHTSNVSAVSWHPGGSNVVSVDKARNCIVWV